LGDTSPDWVAERGSLVQDHGRSESLGAVCDILESSRRGSVGTSGITGSVSDLT
jgi:hypothetical protein